MILGATVLASGPSPLPGSASTTPAWIRPSLVLRFALFGSASARLECYPVADGVKLLVVVGLVGSGRGGVRSMSAGELVATPPLAAVFGIPGALFAIEGMDHSARHRLPRRLYIAATASPGSSPCWPSASLNIVASRSDGYLQVIAGTPAVVFEGGRHDRRRIPHDLHRFGANDGRVLLRPARLRARVRHRLVRPAPSARATADAARHRRREHDSVPPAQRRRPAGVLIGIEIDDVDAVHARIVDAGHPIIRSLRDEPWGQRHFIALDPGGCDG